MFGYQTTDPAFDPSILDPSIVRALARALKPSDTLQEGIDRAAFVRSGGRSDPSADFCDSFALDNGSVALVVGDVCGCGPDTAAYVPQVRAILRLLLYADPNPAQALAGLNTALCRADQDPDSQPWFACVSIAVIDPCTGLGRFACGGSEPPMIVSTTAMHRSLRVGGLPPGVQEDATYCATQYTLSRSDLVLMATDGILNAGGFHMPLGSERLLKWANGLVPMHSLHAIGQTLMDEIEAFAKGEMADDAALLLARLV